MSHKHHRNVRWTTRAVCFYSAHKQLRIAALWSSFAPPFSSEGYLTASIVANIYRTGEVSEEDRTYLAGAVAARTDLTQAQAKERVDQIVTQAQEARQEVEDAVAAAKAEAEQAAAEAKEAAVEAAQTARNAGILTAFVLAAASLIAGVASVAGSVHGGRHRDQGRLFAGLTYRG